jgi:hypothetical protein
VDLKTLGNCCSREYRRFDYHIIVYLSVCISRYHWFRMLTQCTPVYVLSDSRIVWCGDTRRDTRIHVWAVIFFRRDLCASTFFIGRNSYYKNVQLILTTHSIAIILTKHQTSIITKVRQESGRYVIYRYFYVLTAIVTVTVLLGNNFLQYPRVAGLRKLGLAADFQRSSKRCILNCSPIICCTLAYIFFFPLDSSNNKKSSNFHASTEF